MFALSLLVLCAGAALVASVPNTHKTLYLEEKFEELFEEFIQTHNKKYTSDDEKQKKYAVFKDNLKDINVRNMDPNHHAEFGITKFSDLTKEEFLMYNGLLPVGDMSDNAITLDGPVMVDLPESFDWRDKNVVTHVKDQGQCGSCYAFSAIGNFESQYAIKHKELVEFSEQQVVSCDKFDNGCGGGTMWNVFSALNQMGGVETEASYPYEGKPTPCKFDVSKVKGKVASYNALDLSKVSEEKLREYLYNTGPVSMALASSDLQQYKKGIIQKCESNSVDHAVLIVGYGIENNVPYWTFKNSWSAEFGEKGYFRLQRDKNVCNFKSASAVMSVPE